MPTLPVQSGVLKNVENKREIANSAEAQLESLASELGLDDVPEPEEQNTEERQKGFINNLTDIPSAAAGGLLKAAQETGNAVNEFSNWVDEKLGTSPLIDTREEFTFANDLPNALKSNTATGDIVSSIAQFVGPFGAAGKALKGLNAATKLGKAAKAGAIGMAVDFAAFDPKEDRLSDLVQKHPMLANPISEYLAGDEDDSELEGRFKNTLEGLGLGIATEGLFLAVRAFKASRAVNKMIGGKPPKGNVVKEGVEEVTDETVEGVAKQVDENPLIRETFEQDKPFITKNAAGEVDVNIHNMNIKDLDKYVEDEAEKFINQKRGVISDEKAQALKEEYQKKFGLTEEDIGNFQQGDIFPIEKMLVIGDIVEKSANNTAKIFKKAKATGKKEDMVAAVHALNNFTTLRAHQKAPFSEAGRVLRVAEKMKSVKQMDEYANMFRVEDSEDAFNLIADFDSKKFMNVADKISVGKKIRNAAYEVWINGLLSGLSTHTANILSGASAVVGTVGSRATAFTLGKMGITKDAVPWDDVSASVIGGINGFGEGIVAASKILAKGKINTRFTKLADSEIGALSAEAFEASGTVGRGLDVLGEVVRSPGRALLAEDEFFKAINYRMEAQVLATKQATREGLSGTAFKDRIKDLVENPPEHIRIKSEKVARVNTFTEKLGPKGQAIDNFVKKIPLMRVVSPFVRTNINLVQYAMDHNPIFLAPGIRNMNKNVMAEYAAGGARKQMAQARMAFGGGIMAVVATHAVDGNITGGGPSDFRSRKILEESGWQPYSIRVGNKYYSYDRLDPYGSLMGLAADFADIIGKSDKETGDVAAISMAAAIGNAFTPEFLTTNTADFLQIFSKGTDNMKRNFEKFAKNLAGSAVPFSGFVRSIRKEVDPVKRDTKDISFVQEMVNAWKNTIPGYSKDLPPQRNIFGEVVVYQGGWGPDIASPIATSTHVESPAYKEIVRLGMAGEDARLEPEEGESFLGVDHVKRTIKKTIAGKAVDIELSAKQYDKLVMLSAGIGLKNNPYSMTLEEKLSREVERGFSSFGSIGKTDAGRRIIIKAIIRGYRKLAQHQFMQEEDDVADELLLQQNKRIDALGL